MFCRQQVAELAKHQAEFDKNGGNLVIIGSGQSDQLPALRAATGYQGTLLTDPQRKTYTFLGLNRSVGGVIGLKMVARAVRSIASGYRPGTLQGDALQLGGAITITVDNRVSYFFKSSEAGEHPPVADLLASLDHV
ncbi:redoxin domain-containing protein [bacterium]|nr:redoxin domain-containing protein [bacterium]